MMATARRSRRGWRGSLVALGLVLFVALATLVVWRRGRGVAEARQIGALVSEIRELQSQKTAMERDLNDATSRTRIVAAAESRLGMHVATDAEVPSLPAAAPVPVARGTSR